MSKPLKPARAVILAAGQGKRMRSSKPKVLHDVLGKPILARILDTMDRLPLDKVHIVVGHESEQVENYVKENPPKAPWSSHLQAPQLGTGHALQQVVPDLDSFKGTLLVTVGDTPLLTASTLGQFLSKHHEDNAVVSLLTTYVDDPKNYGRIVRDVIGKVTRIVEDKDANEDEKRIREINPAIYCFEWPDIADGLNTLKSNNRQGEYYLTDLIGWAHEKELPMSTLVALDSREVAGINSRLELAEAARFMRDQVVFNLSLEHGVTVLDPDSTWISPEVSVKEDTTILPGCHITGKVEIDKDCIIGPNTVITGHVRIGPRTTVTQSVLLNCEIGADCKIGPFAHLREGSKVSDKCRVGNFVEIKKSDIGYHTNVSHLSYIGDAVLGEHVNIGAGTITANYDHITRKKERTVIGDGSSTGSNSVLVAPIILGNESVVAAGSVATKDVPDGALAVARTRQQNIEGWTEKRKKGADAS